MATELLRDFSIRRLRWLLLAFFVALAVPTTLLVRHAWSQLKWEAFHQQQQRAQELTRRIDSELNRLIREESARPAEDYRFLTIEGSVTQNVLQRSPLAAFPVSSDVPGLIGHFQVGAQGRFSTPLLPADGISPERVGLSEAEWSERRALGSRMLDILASNALVEDGQLAAGAQPTAPPTLADAGGARPDEGAELDRSMASVAEPEEIAEESAPADREQRRVAQEAFDQLKAPSRSPPETANRQLGRVEDLKLEETYQDRRARDEAKASPEPAAKAPAESRARERGLKLRKEQALDTDALGESLDDAAAGPATRRVRTFESEVGTLEMSLLESGHFVLYRNVWRDGQRLIQGALLESDRFLGQTVAAAFRETALARASDLVVAWDGSVLNVIGDAGGRRYSPAPSELEGALLHRARLSAPLSSLELIFSIRDLPAGPGTGIVGWLALILFTILAGGCYGLYRLGKGQIALARQQQDFVSAVSHELKTPLTSIRMYGEMLQEGWVSDEKRGEYYGFITDESERLSRLIHNVLQLARMTRKELELDCRPIPVSELMDSIRSKVATPVERAGFGVELRVDEALREAAVAVDADAFTQVMINLVDNALKFSRKATRREIHVHARGAGKSVEFSVRDFGPGIPKDQLKKIFRLFYRSENELTRETVGTGIGLALVHQLVTAMNGSVDVVNRDPGAEFRIVLPGA